MPSPGAAGLAVDTTRQPASDLNSSFSLSAETAYCEPPFTISSIFLSATVYLLSFLPDIISTLPFGPASMPSYSPTATGIAIMRLSKCSQSIFTPLTTAVSFDLGLLVSGSSSVLSGKGLGSSLRNIVM